MHAGHLRGVGDRDAADHDVRRQIGGQQRDAQQADAR